MTTQNNIVKSETAFHHNFFQNYNWRVSLAITQTGKRMHVENLVTGFCDWPIRYDDGRIAYDYPERLPKYIKSQVAKAFRRLIGDSPLTVKA